MTITTDLLMDAKKSLAVDRWRILRKAVLAASRHHSSATSIQHHEETSSVRSFSSFNLFTTSEVTQDILKELFPGFLEQKEVEKPDSVTDEGRWIQYKVHNHPQALSTSPNDVDDSKIGQTNSVEVVVKYLPECTSLEAMMGFNNTGNVCVWPSEEVLAYYCWKYSHEFAGSCVCELGSGMTGLAGIVLARTQQPSYVLLTDGNKASVENVGEIISVNRNNFGKVEVQAELLVWDKLFLSNPSSHDTKFDYMICADCLFFESVHIELVQVIRKLLKSGGRGVIFAPGRSGTLDKFCEAAKLVFKVEQTMMYDDVIWDKHQHVERHSTNGYKFDLHYPIMLTLLG